MDSGLEKDRSASFLDVCCLQPSNVKAVGTTNYIVVKELQSIPLMLTANLKPLRCNVNRHETFGEVISLVTCTVTGRLELKPFSQDVENAIFAMQIAHGIRFFAEEGRPRSKV
jgi:hypothetical protein